MTETSDAPAESTPKSQIRFFELFRLTAELSAILSIAAFALSVWLNGIVFSHWGQDFLQLASPTDVLMSGLLLLAYFIGPLAVAFALTSIFPILNAVEVEDESAPKKIRDRIIVYTIYLTVFLLLAFPFVIAGLALSGNLDVSKIVYFHLGMLTFGFAAMHIYGNLFDEPDPWSVMSGTLSAAVVGLTGLFLVIGWFDARVAKQARNGFHPTRLSVFIGKDELCAGSRVLWSGSQSTLVECDAGRPNSQIMILRDGENVQFRPSQAPSPAPAVAPAVSPRLSPAPPARPSAPAATGARAPSAPPP